MPPVGPILRHPLFIAAATLIVTVFFADRIARVSGDRQRELELKERLLTQVADSSTRAVSRALERAQAAPSNPRRKALYNDASGTWKVEWSRVNPQLQVYFDDDAILGEWSDFARRYDLYLRVALLQPSSRESETKQLRAELTSREFTSDPAQRSVARAISWDCIERPTQGCHVIDDLALVGQLLLLHRSALDRRILDEPAAGFAQRMFPPW